MPDPENPQDAEVPAGPAKRRAVIVAGMHRSGTSPLSRVLGLLGLQLPASPMGATAANRLGHWGESEPIYEAHEALLASAGTSWDEPGPMPAHWFASSEAAELRSEIAAIVAAEYPGSETFLLKDPRICRLLPFWNEVLDELDVVPSYVLPIRNPLEVAASLARRDGLSYPRGLMIWLRHLLEAESGTRGAPRAVLSYRRLLDDWRAEVLALGEAIELELPQIDSHAASAEIESYLSLGERHHEFEPSELELRPEVGAWVSEAFAVMAEASEQRREPDRKRLDALASALGEADRALDPLLAEERLRARELGAELALSQRERRRLDDQLTATEAANAELVVETERLEARLGEASEQLAELTTPGRWPRLRALIGLGEAGDAAPTHPVATHLRTARQIASWLAPPSRAGLQRLREFLVLRRSPEFDAGFYVRRNPDVARAGMNPVLHYVEHGAGAGLDPNPSFSTSAYLRSAPGLEASGVNPLYHHIKHGGGRRPMEGDPQPPRSPAGANGEVADRGVGSRAE